MSCQGLVRFKLSDLTALTKAAWYLSVFSFVLLLPYVVLKRPLWFPGIAMFAYQRCGWAKLTPADWGALRFYYLLLIAGVLILGGILMERRRRPRSTGRILRGSDHAPLLLVLLIVLMLVRMAIEYASTGLAFFSWDMTDLVIGTLLPCLVLVIHPGQEDAFLEILRGVALGAIVSLIPVFVATDLWSALWADLTLGAVARAFVRPIGDYTVALLCCRRLSDLPCYHNAVSSVVPQPGDFFRVVLDFFTC